MIDTESIRKKLLDLALCGKLTEQYVEDGDVAELVKEIEDMREGLINRGTIKKEKEVSILSKEDIPFDIPSNWTWMRVSEIAYLTSGKPYEEVSKGELYIKVSDMNIPGNETCITTSEHFVSENNSGRIPKYSIIFPKRGGAIATNKKRTVVDREIFVDLNTMGMTVIKPEIFLYVKVWFDSKRLDELQTGTSIPQINNKDIYPLLIPMPPLKEQERIVQLINEVDEKLSVIDEFQKLYAADVEILKSKLIDAGIQGKLTEQFPEDGTAELLYEDIQKEKARLIKEKKIKNEKALAEISEEEIPFEIPNNWKWVRLGDICSKISSGSTPTGGSKGGAYVTNGYCFFREQNIYNDGIHNEGMVYIKEELLNARENSTVLPKDILLNITGGSIGRCALIPDDFSRGSINQHILIIRVVDPQIRFYVHKCLCSPYYQRLIMGNVVGDKDGFSAGRCKDTLIPLPPIAEQKRIVDKISELLSLI